LQLIAASCNRQDSRIKNTTVFKGKQTKFFPKRQKGDVMQPKLQETYYPMNKKQKIPLVPVWKPGKS
jgi:hypothetical protein